MLLYFNHCRHWVGGWSLQSHVTDGRTEVGYVKYFEQGLTGLLSSLPFPFLLLIHSIFKHTFIAYYMSHTGIICKLHWAVMIP